MKHHHRSQNVDSCGRKRSHYDKEMDHAFTLIFHNIKRLQDGHLSNSTTTLEQAEGKSEITTCTNTIEVPLRRERSRSDTSLLRYTGDMRTLIELQSNMTRPKSRSHCGEVACPAETRKVRFSDDYVTRKEDIRRPPLTKRPWSDQPPRPAIVVTKESWHQLYGCWVKFKNEGNFSKKNDGM